MDFPFPAFQSDAVSEGKTIRGPAVALEAVSKRHPGGGGIADVSLAVAGGSFVALVGASGAGKSTLVKLINALLRPDAGRVSIDGHDVTRRNPHQLRRAIGYVIQGVGLFPHLDVAGNIAMPLQIAPPRPAQSERDARIGELLDRVDLPREFATRMPDTLSGGERQRVGFARALARAPGLMLMDEPFGALDPVTRDALGRSYRALHERLGLTSIMVTHDMAEALLLADRVVVLEAGRIVADATPQALLDGAGGPIAQALVAIPRDQAARLAALRA
ncbi:MAG: ATP-binding cassette domain-containing protein [Sphingomonadaceae bacterium]